MAILLLPRVEISVKRLATALKNSAQVSTPLHCNAVGVLKAAAAAVALKGIAAENAASCMQMPQSI